MLRKALTSFFLVVLLAGMAAPLGAGPSVAAIGAVDLVGLEATYEVTSQGTERLEVSRSEEDASQSVLQSTKVHIIENRVVDRDADLLTVETTIVDPGGTEQAYVYEVPVGSVMRPIPGKPEPGTGGGNPFAGSWADEHPDGSAVRVTFEGEVVNDWVVAVRVDVTSALTPVAELKVRLIGHSGSDVQLAPGLALFLLPALTSPTEGVRAINGPGVADLAVSGTEEILATTTWAASRLTTVDNSFANAGVWYSDFRHDAVFSDTGVNYELTLFAEPTFPNWFAISGSLSFGQITATEAEGFGESQFLGVFLFGPLYWGQAFHQINLRETEHETWLRGTIERGGTNALLFDTWCPWKDEQFFDGETAANETRQDESWFIIANVDEFFQLATTPSCP